MKMLKGTDTDRRIAAMEEDIAREMAFMRERAKIAIA